MTDNIDSDTQVDVDVSENEYSATVSSLDKDLGECALIAANAVSESNGVRLDLLIQSITIKGPYPDYGDMRSPNQTEHISGSFDFSYSHTDTDGGIDTKFTWVAKQSIN